MLTRSTARRRQQRGAATTEAAVFALLVAACAGCAAAAEVDPDPAGYDDPGDDFGLVSRGGASAGRTSGTAAGAGAETGGSPDPAPSAAPPGPPPPAPLKDTNPSEAEVLTKCSTDTQQWWRKNKDRDITFVAFGDTQTSSFEAGCRQNAHFREKQSGLMRAALSSVDTGAHVWPGGEDFLRKGEPFDHVRGVLIAGDLTQSGSDAVPAGTLSHDCPEYTAYRGAFGRCGTEGKLKFPVYESYGNHDFPWVAGAGDPDYHPVIDYLDRIEAEHRPGGLGELYDDPVKGTGHYAWRWDDVWFVNLNVKPGWVDEVIEKDHTRIVAPHDSLAFLKSFLASRTKSEARQLVLMTHYPLSSPRIENKERAAFCKLLDQAQSGTGPFSEQKLSRSFPVIHIHGHTHHAPAYQTWSCPKPYASIEIPTFNVGTPLFPHEHNGPGYLHFTVFRLGNRNLEVVGVGAKKSDPTGKWSYVLQKRLPILHEP